MAERACLYTIFLVLGSLLAFLNTTTSFCFRFLPCCSGLCIEYINDLPVIHSLQSALLVDSLECYQVLVSNNKRPQKETDS